MPRPYTIVLLLVAACAPADEFHFALGEIEFSAPPGSAEPNLFAAPDGRVLLSWHEPTGDEQHALRVAMRTPDGWSAPTTVAQDRDFFVNWADFPSVIEEVDGALVVHWLEWVAATPYAYHVMVSRSTDGGATWSEAFRPHRDLSPTEHGFVSMVPRPDGGASLLWLDGRNTNAEGLGAMTLRFTSVASDGTLGEELLVDDRVCSCCQTAMVRTDGGPLIAAYRDRSEAEIRDIAIARFDDGHWSEPYHVARDNWHMPACPVNGPSLATAGNRVVVTWFTAPDGDNRVSVAFSDDGAESFGAAVRIDDGNPQGRVDVELLPDGSALVVWLERVGESAEVRARRVEPSGTTHESWLVAATSPTRRSGFPRMVVLDDEVLFAWTVVGEEGGVSVATASWQ